MAEARKSVVIRVRAVLRHPEVRTFYVYGLRRPAAKLGATRAPDFP